jgi:hypothetical protein
MQRWEEEEQLLREEFKRCFRTFKFLSSAWTKTIREALVAKPGYNAYACERADMYNAMAEDCIVSYKSTTGEDLDTTMTWYVVL